MARVPTRRWSSVIVVLVLAVMIPAAAFAGTLFSDVDDGSTHIAGITYMKDTGITLGCGDGTAYCPDDPVTRAQMASFLYRMSGNDPATAPNVNADMLDGKDSSAFAEQADLAAFAEQADLPELTSITDETPVPPFPAISSGNARTEILSVDVEAPADGFALLLGDVYMNNNAANTVNVNVFLNMDGEIVELNSTQMDANSTGSSSNDLNRSTLMTVVPVSAGTHTISMELEAFNGTSYNIIYYRHDIAAVFFPASQATVLTNP